FVRHIGASDLAESRELLAEPSRSAADLQNVEIATPERRDPVLHHLSLPGLDVRLLPVAVSAMLRVPGVPEPPLLVQFDRSLGARSRHGVEVNPGLLAQQ